MRIKRYFRKTSPATRDSGRGSAMAPPAALRRATFLAVALLASVLHFASIAHAQFQQTRSPAAAGDCTNVAGIGTLAWGTPGNAISSDNSYASRSVDGTTSNFLRCVNYGFSIPPGATILGIEVNVERKSSSAANGGSRDAAMRLVKAGAIEATDRSTATTYPTTDTVETHGNSVDLWGTTWSPAEINAANFGAAFAVTKPNAAGGAHTVTVDHMEITVHFSFVNNPPPAPALVSPADGATVTTATPTFTWSAAVDPDGHAVTYDIQADDSGCAFASPEIDQAGLAGTSFVPGAALANATYCWRVRAVDEYGAMGPWSATRNVTVNAPPAVSQTRSPAAAGDCTNVAGIGTLAWGTPGNAISSDNSYASRSVDGTTSNFLRCVNYGFSIPPGATILGIEVNVERKSSSTNNGGSRDAAMRLVKALVIQATDRSTATTYPTTDTVEAHGGAADLWGTTWTPAEINAANFGAAFAVTKPNAAGAAHTVTVDHMQIVVYYSLPPPVVDPGDFNAFESSTAGGAITGQVYTKLAGAGFALDVVAILAGAQHATFTNAVQVDLVTGATGGLGCGSPVAIGGTSQNVNLVNGRGTTGAFNVATAYPNVRVRVSYLAVTSCSTDNFAIRPVAFSSVTAPVLTNAGTTGAPSARAGDSFQLDAVAGAGYNGTPVIDPDPAKIIAHAGAIRAGTLSGAFSAANPAGGTATGSTFTYSEAGNFRIDVNGVYDSSFTAVDTPGVDCTADFSNTPVGGRYGCRFGNSAQTAPIGRFTPDHFDVLLTPPTFATACAAGGFTYVGQRFDYTVQPVITVTAKTSAGLGNQTTQNYQGSWWKITSGTLTGKAYTALSGALDTSGAPGADPTIRYNGDGAGPGEPAAGDGTLTFSSGTGFSFTRTTPSAEFNAEISLAINVIDADGITHAGNPARFGAATAGNGIAFNNGKPMRFGRLRLHNASGSQLLPLSVQAETQYWNGGSFITNVADACTAVAAANIAMGGYTGSLTDSPNCLTAISGGGAFSAGRRTFLLAAPGGGGNGSVLLTANLAASPSGNTCTAIGVPPAAATTANRPYLQDGPAYNQDPAARATFGVRRGSDEVIHIREIFQ